MKAASRPEDPWACLLRATQELNAAPDLVGGLERVAACLRDYIPFDTMGVLLLDELGRELQFAFTEGYEAAVAEHWRFGMGQGLVGTVAETGIRILVDDVTADERYINAASGTRSELALPLVAKGRTIGVLDLGSSTPGHFEASHLALLEPLADQLAVAIDNARLYQKLREQTEVLSLLHEVSRELASILDMERLLETVAEAVGRLIDYDVFALFVWNEEARQLEPAIAVHRDGTRMKTAPNLTLGQGVCGTAAALRQSLRVPNVHLDPRYVQCVTNVDVRSEVAVPLTVKDRLIGVLDLESTEYDAFTPQHEQALSTLASSLAIALENARLYERLRADERRLEEDLSTAREIQKQLLPKRSPWLPGLQFGVGYEPARHLGGDFYDFLTYDEGRVAVAVGDVAGKATSAALYGSLAAGMLREIASQIRPGPPRLLEEMNGKLLLLEIPNRFLAMAFGVYDAETRILELANAGLPRPFLLRGGEASPLDLSGVPLGLLPDRSYERTSIELRPGDAVVVCSDGIEEGLNPREEELGAEAIIETLRAASSGTAQEIADAVIAAVEHHAEGAEPSDDRTVLVVKAV
jgi:sigma-B regulation protein RsbU (phosphoserine phosphatase)